LKKRLKPTINVIEYEKTTNDRAAREQRILLLRVIHKTETYVRDQCSVLSFQFQNVNLISFGSERGFEQPIPIQQTANVTLTYST
jgi:hypothetical protein